MTTTYNWYIVFQLLRNLHHALAYFQILLPRSSDHRPCPQSLPLNSQYVRMVWFPVKKDVTVVFVPPQFKSLLCHINSDYRLMISFISTPSKKKKKKIVSMSWDAVRNREHSVKQRKSVALPVQGKLSKGYLSPAVDLSVTYFRVFSLTLTE